MDNVLAVILGGGIGSRLYPLTKYRAKPAVPLGGKYRLVDIPVSNCIHSDIRKIYVITQYNSESLNRSVFETYQFDIFSKGYIRILAAEQTHDSRDWLQGTADAIRKNIKHMSDGSVEYVLILSGDQLYRLDFKKLVSDHIASGMDVTLAVTASEADKAPNFGLVKIDEAEEIKAFVEKPDSPEVINDFLIPASVKEKFGLGFDKPYVLANMGIYVFSRKFLTELMETTTEADFGKHIFPNLLNKVRMKAFVHIGYWEDIGTIKAFYEANLDLARPLPAFNCYDMERPIYAQPLFLPPTKIENSSITNSLISDGCILNKAYIRNSVIGIRTIIESDSVVDDSIIMGSDFYDLPKVRNNGGHKLGIGKNCVIKKAIIDKNARIGNNVQIINQYNEHYYEGPNYMIKDGIVVIEKGAIIPDGTII